jgi:hypothetical protein
LILLFKGKGFVSCEVCSVLAGLFNDEEIKLVVVKLELESACKDEHFDSCKVCCVLAWFNDEEVELVVAKLEFEVGRGEANDFVSGKAGLTQVSTYNEVASAFSTIALCCSFKGSVMA